MLYRMKAFSGLVLSVHTVRIMMTQDLVHKVAIIIIVTIILDLSQMVYAKVTNT